ncbi:MAG: sulfotransferase family protein [Thiobacillus sp.]|nr:sulfotransferase family protein [Thiobacillus sp.]
MNIVFIHIAKAAGSTVNRYFLDRLGRERCALHIESDLAWRDDEARARLVTDKTFLSGHIMYREFRDKLDLGDCFTFTFLRDPRAQVVSHLAWIRRLAESAEAARLAAHPPYIARLAGKLAGLDLGNAGQMAGFVAGLGPEEHALLDNPQVRYLRGGRNQGPVNEGDVQSAKARLGRLDAFGVVEELQDGLAGIARALGLAPPATLPSENVQEDKYGMSAADPRLMAALHPLIRHDLELYAAAVARRAGWPGAAVDIPPLDYDQLHGHLDQATGRVVSGWARLADMPEPVALDVRVNGERRATVTADRPRPDLAEKFGRDCAFSWPCEPGRGPNAGDLVSVVVSGTGIELEGSPMRCP